jgi:hypothetical protein
MEEFANIFIAVERVMGSLKNTFVSTYNSNRMLSKEISFESVPLALAVIDLDKKK